MITLIIEGLIFGLFVIALLCDQVIHCLAKIWLYQTSRSFRCTCWLYSIPLYCIHSITFKTILKFEFRTELHFLSIERKCSSCTRGRLLRFLSSILFCHSSIYLFSLPRPLFSFKVSPAGSFIMSLIDSPSSFSCSSCLPSQESITTFVVLQNRERTKYDGNSEP